MPMMMMCQQMMCEMAEMKENWQMEGMMATKGKGKSSDDGGGEGRHRGGRSGRRSGGGGGGGGESRTTQGGGRATQGGGETKRALNNVVLKICSGRPEGGDLKRGEIEYSCQEVMNGAARQAQVIVKCLPNSLAGQPFVGKPCPTEKEAIESAATMAMETILGDPELKELHDREKQPRKRDRGKESNDGVPTPKNPRTEQAAGGRGGGIESNKALLNNAVLKMIAGRPEGGLKKGEIEYTTTGVGNNQKQTKVAISCLPDKSMASICWSGETCATEKEAVNSAAAVALEAIMSNASLKALHDRPKDQIPWREAPFQKN